MDLIRKLSLGGDGLTNASEDLQKLEGASPNQTFLRGVVYKTLDDLSSIDEENEAEINQILEELTNPDDFFIAPRNSIIVKYISNGTGRSNQTKTVCFPFFSSHLCLPLKVGEQVWIMRENPTNSLGRGFWMSRIHEPIFVEDPNYTHGDRRYGPTSKELNVEIKEDETEEALSIYPTFHNGVQKSMDDSDLWTITPGPEYENIYTGSIEEKQFLIEPVPRYTKRPGDLVLQGSHNSTIVLGTDRGYTAGEEIDRKKSNAAMPEKLKQGKGSIDIVVGRGRLFGELKALEEKDPTRTEPRVIKNEPGSTKPTEGRKEGHETDKNLTIAVAEDSKEKSNTKTDACEGDPDFVNDSSRLYLTMNSSPDEEFNIVPNNIPQPFKAEPKSIKDTAATVLKADEVRIIARKTGLDSQKNSEMTGDNAPKKEINGSIRLIKEGKLDDDAASIYILPDGTIQISGKVIYIGRTSDDKGKEDGSGEKGSEPYLRMSDFEKWADGLIDAVNTAFDNAQAEINDNGTKINTMASAGSGPGVSVGGSTPGWGSPNSALGGAVAGAFAGGMSPSGMSYSHASDKSAIEEFKSTKDAMESIKSERIFGE